MHTSGSRLGGSPSRLQQEKLTGLTVSPWPFDVRRRVNESSLGGRGPAGTVPPSLQSEEISA
jgi:hypothetical protein